MKRTRERYVASLTLCHEKGTKREEEGDRGIRGRKRQRWVSSCFII